MLKSAKKISIPDRDVCLGGGGGGGFSLMGGAPKVSPLRTLSPSELSELAIRSRNRERSFVPQSRAAELYLGHQSI